MVKEHYDYLVSRIQKLNITIDTLTKPFEPAINLLCAIPGIKRDSAIIVLSEIGTDIFQFGLSKRFCR